MMKFGCLCTGHFLTRPGGKFWRLLRCAADVTRTVAPQGPTPTPQPLGQPTPHRPALRVLFLPWGTTLEFSVSQVLTSTAPTTRFLDSNFYWQAVRESPCTAVLNWTFFGYSAVLFRSICSILSPGTRKKCELRSLLPPQNGFVGFSTLRWIAYWECIDIDGNSRPWFPVRKDNFWDNRNQVGYIPTLYIHIHTYITLHTYIHIYVYIYTYIFIMKGLVVLQNSTSFVAPGNWPRPDANRAHFTGKLAVDAGTHSWHLSRSRNLWSSGP